MLNLEEYRATIEAMYVKLRKTTGQSARCKPDQQTWSLQEIVGHLIDSACNNHQRFVRLQAGHLFDFPPYDGGSWVELQNYNSLCWGLLVDLWYNYNCLLLEIVSNMQADVLGNTWRVEGEAHSLEWLVADYYRHLNWHISQAEKRLASGQC